MGLKHLDGHWAVERGVPTQIDIGHPAAPQQTLDLDFGKGAAYPITHDYVPLMHSTCGWTKMIERDWIIRESGQPAMGDKRGAEQSIVSRAEFVAAAYLLHNA